MKDRNTKRKKYCVIITFIVCCFFLSSQAYALDEETIINILKDNSDFFVQNTFMDSTFRAFKWGIVKILYMVCEQAESLYLNCFKLLTFTTGESIEQFIASLAPMYKGLLILSITATGLFLMFFRRKIPNFLVGIVLSIGIITCTFFVMAQLNKAIYDVNTETGLVTWAMGEKNSITNDVIRTNIYDLLYIDNYLENGLEGFNINNLESYHYPELSDEDLEAIDITEVINFESEYLSDSGKKILKKSLLKTPQRAYVLENVSSGISIPGSEGNGFGNGFYYRYKMNFFDVLLSLFAFVIVYVSLTYRAIKVIVNMIISRILSVLYSADLTGHKKTIMILNAIKDGYIALFLSAVLIRMYSMLQAYINGIFEEQPVVNTIMLLLVAFAILTGPSIIEKVTGYNMGSSGSLGMMYGAAQLAKGAFSLGKAGVKGLGHLADAMSNFNTFGGNNSWTETAWNQGGPSSPAGPTGSSGAGTNLQGGSYTGLENRDRQKVENGTEPSGVSYSTKNPYAEKTEHSGKTENSGQREPYAASGMLRQPMGQDITNGSMSKGHNPSAENKENELYQQMQKMSRDTSKEEGYNSAIANLNSTPSELEDDFSDIKEAYDKDRKEMDEKSVKSSGFSDKRDSFGEVNSNDPLNTGNPSAEHPGIAYMESEKVALQRKTSAINHNPLGKETIGSQGNKNMSKRLGAENEKENSSLAENREAHNSMIDRPMPNGEGMQVRSANGNMNSQEMQNTLKSIDKEMEKYSNSLDKEATDSQGNKSVSKELGAEIGSRSTSLNKNAIGNQGIENISKETSTEEGKHSTSLNKENIEHQEAKGMPKEAWTESGNYTASLDREEAESGRVKTFNEKGSGMQNKNSLSDKENDVDPRMNSVPLNTLGEKKMSLGDDKE